MKKHNGHESNDGMSSICRKNKKTNLMILAHQPSGAKEWVAGGNHADENPDFAISGTLLSKFVHQSCLWDSQLKACRIIPSNNLLNIVH